MNLLESLKGYTTVVADTGDFEAIAEHKPQDATTNPSLIFQAAQKPHYQHLVDEALDFAVRSPGDSPAADRGVHRQALRYLRLRDPQDRSRSCLHGGRCRPQLRHRGNVAKARKLIGIYREAGVGRERVLIKIASTWEGIRAAENWSTRASTAT